LVMVTEPKPRPLIVLGVISNRFGAGRVVKAVGTVKPSNGPIAVPVIEPPVMETLLEFSKAIEPKLVPADLVQVTTPVEGTIVQSPEAVKPPKTPELLY